MGLITASATGLPPGTGTETVANTVEKVGSAVVKIDTVSTSGGVDPFFNDPFFRQFFGGPYGYRTQPREQQGLGSGFIISEDGYILTNEHVIDGATKITVTIEGMDSPLPAKVVGSDYNLDLAVLKVDAGRTLPYLKLGDSSKVEVGNWVIAIGNPFGLDHTVTVGVISAKGRPVQVENRSYKNLLQTDASNRPKGGHCSLSRQSAAILIHNSNGTTKLGRVKLPLGFLPLVVCSLNRFSVKGKKQMPSYFALTGICFFYS
ncbi:trypsin-like peptidase domain-containing protein [Desulfoscipio geothermicus]|uniref:Trypsin-like peptidase domain-containing protein n=1 Tax=Desulfoscipio geothermicus DSM 3669 TaxID=1121426 RepID=A0A1I6D256_9FIRM|nr:Trypsin-like peptidase domain-containing protein [Desulfoscipio geothermicus DSM 3669]